MEPQEKIQQYLNGDAPSVPPTEVKPGTAPPVEILPAPPQEKETTKIEPKSPSPFFEHLTVGQGLGLATAILILLLWFLVPTQSGKTRAELLWLTLFNATSLATDTSTESVSGTQDKKGQGGLQSQVPQQELVPLNVDFSSLDMGF
jgi:hypothetical protein